MKNKQTNKQKTLGLSSGTLKAVNTYVKRQILHCRQRGQDPLQPPVKAVLQFLTLPHEEGKGYSSLYTARCAISTLSFGKDTVGVHLRCALPACQAERVYGHCTGDYTQVGKWEGV